MTVISQYPPNNGDEWDCQCARCGSSLHFEHCNQCDDGYVGHDCGEDCCSCAEPEDNVVCDQCDGRRGWYICTSVAEFCEKNPLPGREDTKRGTIEWYSLGSTGEIEAGRA